MAVPTTSASASAPPQSGLRWATIALMVVGLIFFALQVFLVPRPFGFSTDEVTYLAKVDPSVPELYWTQPRAWGMPALAAPVAVFSPGVDVIRLYFGFLSSVGLVAAFWPWLRLLAPAVAPLAALLFSTTWMTVFFGSLVMPNLYVGLGAVAVVGLTLRAARNPQRWRALLAGAAAAFVAFVRPTDSVLVLAPLVAGVVAVRRLRRLDVLVALVVGELLGWLPWVVEAYMRFGGPITRVRAAETAGPGGLRLNLANLLIYPRLLDGTPAYCCKVGALAAAGPLPLPLTGWLIAIPMVALIGVATAFGQRKLPELLLVCLPAGLLAAFYLLLPSFTTLRFLLPVFALLSLPVAAALVGLLTITRGRKRTVAVAVVAAVLIAHLGLMLPQAEHVLAAEQQHRARPVRVASALHRLIGGRPCLVVGQEVQPIAFYLGCRVQQMRTSRQAPPRVREAQRNRSMIVAVLSHRPHGNYLAPWRRVRLPDLPHGVKAYVPR